MEYPWIYLDIPSFLKPDFSAGPCCWTHSMRTRLLVVKSVLLHAPPWQLCQGKRWSTNGSLPPLPWLTQPPALRLCGGRLGGGRFLFTRPRSVVVFVFVFVAVAVAITSAVAALVAVAASSTTAAASASGGGGCGAGFFTGFVALETFLSFEQWSRR